MQLVKQILQDNKIYVPYQILDDLIQECILGLLEYPHAQDEIVQRVRSIAYQVLYKYKKDRKFLHSVDLDTLEASVIQHLPTAAVDSDTPRILDALSIKELILSKGDYKIVELTKLLHITRTTIYNAITGNKLGIKTLMLLRKLPIYNKHLSRNELLRLLVRYQITYKELTPIISTSTWYYGVKQGFSYTQLCSIYNFLAKSKPDIKNPHACN